MSYICTVTFKTDVSNLERAEREFPEIIGNIMKAAEGRMKSHTRYARDGYTMDIDEYESKEAYDAFIAEAREHIIQYGEKAGAPAEDHLWKRQG